MTKVDKMNAKIDHMVGTAKTKVGHVVDDVVDVTAVAAEKAGHGVHFVGEKVKATGEKVKETGEKIMKLVD